MLKCFDCLQENKETCCSLFSCHLITSRYPDNSSFYCPFCFLSGLKKLITLMCSSAVMQITRGIPPVRFFLSFLSDVWEMMWQFHGDTDHGKAAQPCFPTEMEILLLHWSSNLQKTSRLCGWALMLLGKCLCSSPLMWTMLESRHCQLISENTLDYQIALGNWGQLAPCHWFKGKISLFSSPSLASS